MNQGADFVTTANVSPNRCGIKWFVTRILGLVGNLISTCVGLLSHFSWCFLVEKNIFLVFFLNNTYRYMFFCLFFYVIYQKICSVEKLLCMKSILYFPDYFQLTSGCVSFCWKKFWYHAAVFWIHVSAVFDAEQELDPKRFYSFLIHSWLWLKKLQHFQKILCVVSHTGFFNAVFWAKARHKSIKKEKFKFFLHITHSFWTHFWL